MNKYILSIIVATSTLTCSCAVYNDSNINKSIKKIESLPLTSYPTLEDIEDKLSSFTLKAERSPSLSIIYKSQNGHTVVIDNLKDFSIVTNNAIDKIIKGKKYKKQKNRAKLVKRIRFYSPKNELIKSFKYKGDRGYPTRNTKGQTRNTKGQTIYEEGR